MTFSGFRPGAVRFLDGLAADNSKGYFDAHRDAYQTDIRGPLEDLTAEAEEKYGPGKVMRPNRDVRFSKDKSPYRLTAAMWAGEVGGVYLSLTRDHIEVGGGIYEPTRDQLLRARTAIADMPRAAAELDTIVKTLATRGFRRAGPSLTTAPRGYDRDHDQIELLRLKLYAAITNIRVTAGRDDVRTAWKQVEPLIAWADEHVGVAAAMPGR